MNKYYISSCVMTINIFITQEDNNNDNNISII